MAEGGAQALEQARKALSAYKAKKNLDPKGKIFPSEIVGNLIGNRVSSGKC
jgi:hypothetical protein